MCAGISYGAWLLAAAVCCLLLLAAVCGGFVSLSSFWTVSVQLPDFFYEEPNLSQALGGTAPLAQQCAFVHCYCRVLRAGMAPGNNGADRVARKFIGQRVPASRHALRIS